MGEKIATRNAYGQALAELANQYPEIVCFDADLAGATMSKFFLEAHPDRFFDMGIAECNMQGVAAGMAACGYKPFTNTFAMFAAGRSWEQIRNSICYPGLNVKVVGSHGGISVGEDGATHQCIEDFAIMRVIPGMTVLCPCDANEMRQAVEGTPYTVYVADGTRGGRHNYGVAVDLTIVDGKGKPLDMGAEFDDFTQKAWVGEKNAFSLAEYKAYVEMLRRKGLISDEAARNRTLLLEIMDSVGLRPYVREWWHYQEKISMPATRERYKLLEF